MIGLAPWSPQAEQFIGLALNDGGLADIRLEVERGVSQLWAFQDESGLCGYAVTRLERYPSGIEWCWVACAAGASSGTRASCKQRRPRVASRYACI